MQFQGAVMKDTHHFQYPAELDLRRYCTHSALADGWGSEYQLGRIVLHLGGSASRGHYMFLQKLDQQRWWLRNDAKVPKVISNEGALACTTDVCALVYYRVPPQR